MKHYSTDIANAVREFLDADDWNYTFHEDKGVFHFNLSTNSRLRTVNFFVHVRSDHYKVLCISPLNANTDNPQDMARMAEFLTRANYGLTYGCFEMDYCDGEIRFRMAVDCDGDTIPAPEVIKSSIYIPASMFSRYGSGIVSTMFSDASPADLVRSCEEDDDDA